MWEFQLIQTKEHLCGQILMLGEKTLLTILMPVPPKGV